MCEFCTQHGEGKKWYENMKNYTAEVFHKVTSERKARKFLNGLYRSMQVDVPRAWQWKKRMPRIYSLLAYPLITRHLKKTHFGQIVPIEDIRRILTTVGSIVRLPCVCRKSTMRKEKRYCLGIGMDMTPLYQDLPDFRGSERLSAGEAVAFVTGLDQEGMMHSVWTLGTPFIGGLCNCDQNCMAYRFHAGMDLGKAMWRAEYVATIGGPQCSGCRECLQRCYFDAVTYDRGNGTCRIDPLKCYGCGICRTVCSNDAITLLPRADHPLAAHNW